MQRPDSQVHDRRSVPESGHRAPKKKKMSKGTKALLIIVCVIVAIALLLVGTVLILSAVGRSALTDDGSGMTMEEYEGDAESLGSGTVRYKGQLYQYNDEIIPVLLLGVDEHEKNVQEGEFGVANQADVNVLAALDPKNGRITMISISRDTMCQMDVLDDAGSHVGTATAQLALAYTYGDGGDVSCELSAAAVSRLFYGLEIPVYASIYMDGITELVDAVGGVTVTPDVSFGPFVAGRETLLTGSNTERYIRYRESTTEGNNQRMQRQNQVLVALVRQMLASVKQNPASVLNLYNNVSRNVTTNLDASKILYLAQQAAKLRFDGEIRNVAGESVLGAQNHAEYQVDEQALYELILDVFYDPVTE